MARVFPALHAAALATLTALATLVALGCQQSATGPLSEAQPEPQPEPRSVRDETNLRPVTDAALEQALAPRAQEILEEHAYAPIGAEIPFEHEGEPFVARIEIHEHPHGGPRRPWGPHRGVTVYHAAP